MNAIKLSEMSEEQLLEIVLLNETRLAHYPWLDVADIQLSVDEKSVVDSLKARLLQDETSLMNEATIWSRGIYPLLVLAERGDVRAWAEVPLSANFKSVKLSGTADGVLAPVVAGIVRTPYLVTLEAKRTLEAKNPRTQFYGQLLIAANLNWQKQPQPSTEIFGCYTIGDIWTFARATIQDMDAEKPSMTIETSREYVERIEAEAILMILKKVVARYSEEA